jgi:hypothetical protein
VQSVKGGLLQLEPCALVVQILHQNFKQLLHISDLICLNSQAPRNTHNLCSTCIIFKDFSSFFQCLFHVNPQSKPNGSLSLQRKQFHQYCYRVVRIMRDCQKRYFKITLGGQLQTQTLHKHLCLCFVSRHHRNCVLVVRKYSTCITYNPSLSPAIADYLLAMKKL